MMQSGNSARALMWVYIVSEEGYLLQRLWRLQKLFQTNQHLSLSLRFGRKVLTPIKLWTVHENDVRAYSLAVVLLGLQILQLKSGQFSLSLCI